MADPAAFAAVAVTLYAALDLLPTTEVGGLRATHPDQVADHVLGQTDRKQHKRRERVASHGFLSG